MTTGLQWQSANSFFGNIQLYPQQVSQKVHKGLLVSEPFFNQPGLMENSVEEFRILYPGVPAKDVGGEFAAVLRGTRVGSNFVNFSMARLRFDRLEDDRGFDRMHWLLDHEDGSASKVVIRSRFVIQAIVPGIRFDLAIDGPLATGGDVFYAQDLRTGPLAIPYDNPLLVGGMIYQGAGESKS